MDKNTPTLGIFISKDLGSKTISIPLKKIDSNSFMIKSLDDLK